jgi:hypothetical protein
MGFQIGSLAFCCAIWGGARASPRGAFQGRSSWIVSHECTIWSASKKNAFEAFLGLQVSTEWWGTPKAIGSEQIFKDLTFPTGKSIEIPYVDVEDIPTSEVDAILIHVDHYRVNFLSEESSPWDPQPFWDPNLWQLAGANLRHADCRTGRVSLCSEKYSSYPLVMTNIAMENHHAINR